MTAGGGNLIGSELNRNKRSPQCGAAPIEIAERRKMSDRELCQAAYQEMYLAMIAKDIPALSAVLDDSFVLLRMTGMENYYACQDQLSKLRTEIAAFVGFDNVDQLVYGDETFAKESELLTTYPDAVSLVNSYWETWHRTNEIEKLVPEWYEQVK